MTLPLLGPMTLSGFAHSWFFLFLFVVAGLVALYILMQLARQRRMLRFANMELLESVAPKRPSRWRHVPAILLVLSLLLFTIAMAGPTHDVRIPRNRAVVMLVIDVSQSMRATDVEPSRMVAAQGGCQAVRRRVDPGHQSGIDCLRGHGDGPGVADDQPGGDQECAGQVTVRRPYRHRGGDLHRAAGHRHGWRGDRWRRHAAAGAHRAVLRRQGDDADQPGQPQGAYTAARTAKDQGVPISTISFGTPYGFVEIDDQRQPVPVDDETMKKVAQLSGGNSYNAATLAELRAVYSSLQQQIGYETIKGDASVGWLRLGALALALAALAALLINRRLPT